MPDRAESDSDGEAPGAKLETATAFIRVMIDAFSRGDMERAEEAYKQARDAEQNPDQKLYTQALYLRARYSRGDSTALDRLQDLVERAKEAPTVLHAVYQLLGSAYDVADDFYNAIEAYERAVEAAESEEQRARYVGALAHTLCESGDSDEAFKRLTNELERATDRTALSTLYSSLASLYKETDNLELRAVALQKATEYKPSDNELRFDAAYASNEDNFNALALMHYDILLRLKPDDSSALNNMGVLYDQLDMPIQGTAFYKAAAKNGNTLAAANLAYQYLNAGFADAAKEVLNTAMKAESVHRNVSQAIAAVGRQEEAQSNKSTETLDAARQQYRFLLAFAEAYFRTPSVDPRFEGDWRLLGDGEVEIGRDTDKLEIKWKQYGKDHAIAGRIRNRGVLITKYSRRDEIMSSSLANSGYGYVSEDGQQIKIMTYKGGEHSFLELKLAQQEDEFF